MDAKTVGLAPLKSQYFFLLTEYQQQPDVLSYVGAESRDGSRIKLQEQTRFLLVVNTGRRVRLRVQHSRVAALPGL